MHWVSAAALCSVWRLDADQTIFAPRWPVTANRSLLICSSIQWVFGVRAWDQVLPQSPSQQSRQSPCPWAIYIVLRCPIILNHPAYFIKCTVEVIVPLDHSFHEVISLLFSVLRIQLRILGKHSPNGLHPPTFRLFEPVSLCKSG